MVPLFACPVLAPAYAAQAMPQKYYLIPAPGCGDLPGRPDQGLPTPPLYPGYPLPQPPLVPGYPLPTPPVDPGWGGGWGGGPRPDQDLPWGPGRPNQDLPWPPVYPGHGLPPAPVRPDNGLPGSGIPWWILPFLIGPAGGVHAGVTEANIPVHPDLPDPTKPGTWILVGVGPGDVRWAWAPTPPVPTPTPAP